MTTATMTVAALVEALWGCYGMGPEAVNGGTYPGTGIPLRKVDPQATLVMVEFDGPQAMVVNHPEHSIVDIADRFGPVLGCRETRRVLEYLAKDARDGSIG